MGVAGQVEVQFSSGTLRSIWDWDPPTLALGESDITVERGQDVTLSYTAVLSARRTRQEATLQGTVSVAVPGARCDRVPAGMLLQALTFSMAGSTAERIQVGRNCSKGAPACTGLAWGPWTFSLPGDAPAPTVLLIDAFWGAAPPGASEPSCPTIRVPVTWGVPINVRGVAAVSQSIQLTGIAQQLSNGSAGSAGGTPTLSMQGNPPPQAPASMTISATDSPVTLTWTATISGVTSCYTAQQVR